MKRIMKAATMVELNITTTMTVMTINETDDHDLK